MSEESEATTVWFDESGFTGEDLLNSEQRHFALASTVIPDDEAETILRQCFPRFAGSEFKSTALWRGTRHRPGLLRFAELLPGLADRTYAYLIDKRFPLLIKFVDYLIEPLVWQSGGDFYRDGYSRRFVNTAHADLVQLGPPGLVDEIVAAWNRVARTPTEQSLAELKTFLAAKKASLPPPLSSFFGLAADGAEFFVTPGERIEDFVSSNDLQVTAMLSSVQHWRSQRRGPLRLIHDETSSFFAHRSTWEALVRNDVEPFTTTGAGGDFSFPLRVSTTSSERSERSASIQLCDVLAGMFAEALRIFDGKRDPFLVELMRAGLGDATFDGVMPERERVDGPPPRRDGPDLLDSMTDVIRPAIDEIRRERERG